MSQTREYVTGEGFTSALAWARLRSILLRVSFLGPIVAVLVGVGALAAVVGPELWGRQALSLVGYLVFLLVLVVAGFVLSKRQAERATPVGSRYSVALGEKSIVVDAGAVSSTLLYESYQLARRRGRFVELVGRRGTARVVLPGQLFPDAELDRLNARLAGR